MAGTEASCHQAVGFEGKGDGGVTEGLCNQSFSASLGHCAMVVRRCADCRPIGSLSKVQDLANEWRAKLKDGSASVEVV